MNPAIETFEEDGNTVWAFGTKRVVARSISDIEGMEVFMAWSRWKQAEPGPHFENFGDAIAWLGEA